MSTALIMLGSVVQVHLSPPRIFHTINGLAHFELGHLCFYSRPFSAVWCIESAGVAAKLQQCAAVIAADLQQQKNF